MTHLCGLTEKLHKRQGKILLRIVICVSLLISGYSILSDQGSSIETINNRTLTIIVDANGNGDYLTIQEGINAASSGDSIVILNGTYYEELSITKSISLSGINNQNVILSGTGNETGISIQSDNVMISNIKIMNYYYGILINDNSDNIRINNTRMENNELSIWCIGTNSNIIIINNSFYKELRFILGHMAGSYLKFENNDACECSSGLKYGTDYIEILNNSLRTRGRAIYGYGSHHIIKNNIISSDIINGIEITGSGEISNNTILGAEHGIYLHNTYENIVEVKNNSITNCTRGIYSTLSSYRIIDNKISNCSGEGMYILGISGNNQYVHRNIIDNAGIGVYSDVNGGFILSKNIITNCNEVAIHLEESNNAIIYNNSIVNNNKSMSLFQTYHNVISHNWFEDNINQIETNGEDIWNGTYPIGGNYWSDYFGIDRKHGPGQDIIGSDGFGDSAYIINSKNSDYYPKIYDVEKPISYIQSIDMIYQGDNAFFDGKNSSDNNMVMKYQWDFFYNEELIQFNSADFHFIFNISNVFTIHLNVSDYSGNWGESVFILTVLDTEKPTAFAPNIQIYQGEIAHFNGSGSYDNIRITNYTWQFKYGTEIVYLFGKIAPYQFMIPGYYGVNLLVKDERGNSANYLLNLTVIDTQAPIANAGPDLEFFEIGFQSFDGSSSTDNGIITKYIWTINNKGNIENVTGLFTGYNFIDYGKYRVILLVEDQFGNQDTDELDVTIKDIIKPTIRVSGLKKLNIGETIVLNASGSFDNTEIVQYIWTIKEPEELIVNGPIFEYKFYRIGFFNITIEVIDSWNNSRLEILTIEVIDTEIPLAVAPDDIQIAAGKGIIFNGSQCSDDGEIIMYKWSFIEEGGKRELNGKIVEYIFYRPGTYKITLFIRDSAMNYAEDTFIVTVIGTSNLRGKVIDSKGKPLSEVRISIFCSDGKIYTGTTREDGSFDIEIYYGNFTWEMALDGYETASGNGTVEAMGEFIIDQDQTVLRKLEDNNGLIIALIIILIILIILVSIIVSSLLFIKVKRANKKENQITQERNGIADQVVKPSPIIQLPENNRLQLPPKENDNSTIKNQLPSLENDKINDMDHLLPPLNEKIISENNTFGDNEYHDSEVKLPLPILEGEYIRPNK